MSASLIHRVTQVQATARRLMWLYGFARFAAAVVLATLGIGLVDFLLRWHDPVARWLFSASLLAAIVVSFRKLALPPLVARHDTVTTARRIERRIPELGERLSSAVAFSIKSADDRTAGSAELRRAVIAEAESITSGVDFLAVLDHRAVRRALLAVATALACVGAIVTLNPRASGLAFSRLVAPWHSLPWPRRHELAFDNPPARIATGDDFEAVVIDRHGALSDDLQIQIRRETASGPAIESRPIRAIGRQAAFRLENVTHGLQYRARGGDDDTMPWMDLAVVEPPIIAELHIDVEPPAYAGLPKTSESPAFRALIGSQVTITATLDQSIAAASLESASPNFSIPPVEVAVGGRELRIPAKGDTWIIERSGAISFELTDQHGTMFAGNTRIEVQAVEDKPPSIAWDAPVDYSFATTAAALPIKAIVKDDVGVQLVQLRYTSSSKGDGEQIIDLYIRKGPNQLALASGGETLPIHSTWELSHIAGLSPGDVLAARITAEDAKPQLATTAVRRVTIITLDEFKSRIAARQSAVLGQLANALRTARQCREQLAATERSALEAARYSLRQVQRLLSENSEGAAGQLVALQDELVTNRADDDATGQQLQELLDQVRGLNERTLPAIDQELTEALKADRDSQNCGSSPGDEVANRLTRLRGLADELVKTLQGMVGSLSQEESLGRIARDVDEIRADQDRLATETGELMLKALSSAGQPSLADQAAARQLGERELELARRLDKLQTAMEAEARLAAALETARQLAIGGRMREAAAQLSKQQLGRAQQSEEELLKALQAILDSIQAAASPKLGAGKEDREPSKTPSDGREPAAKAGSSGTGQGPPRDSSSRGKTQVEMADAKDVIGRIWGHLPEKLREEMQASLSEQFLPKYERLIEEFYKRLAEERPSPTNP